MTREMSNTEQGISNAEGRKPESPSTFDIPCSILDLVLSNGAHAMAARQANREQDLRLELLNSLLTTPHRELAKIRPVHEEMMAKDPRFYVRLGAWYADHGDVRDHKEMFIVTLILIEFEGHPDVRFAILRALPPYES